MPSCQITKSKSFVAWALWKIPSPWCVLVGMQLDSWSNMMTSMLQCALNWTGDMLVECLVDLTIQFQSHLGFWILRTDIWRELQAQPPPPYADFLTFIGHARPLQLHSIPVSRIHCHPTLQELNMMRRCSCGVDPWAICDIHPCYCGCRTWLA